MLSLMGPQVVMVDKVRSSFLSHGACLLQPYTSCLVYVFLTVSANRAFALAENTSRICR